MNPKGPWDEEYRNLYYSYPKVKANIERFTLSVKQPKTEQQKQRMSEAKLGRPFTEEHKEALSKAHHLRQRIREQILEENPDISYRDLWPAIRERYESAK